MCAVAQLVSVLASDTNSKVRSSNPAGNKKSFSIGKLNFNRKLKYIWDIYLCIYLGNIFVHISENLTEWFCVYRWYFCPCFQDFDCLIVYIYTGDRPSGQVAPLPTQRRRWTAAHDSHLQRSLRCAARLHAWEEPEKCSLHRQIHRLFPNTIYSKGSRYSLQFASWAVI